jgi:hypothetical protein
MYALIQKTNNKILQISVEGTKLSETKPFYWVECPEEATTSWVYDGKVFTLPEVLEDTLEQIQNRLNEESLAYLNTTDWYVIRFIETNVEIPDEILKARQIARESIINN